MSTVRFPPVEIKSYTGPREPDVTGERGKAWRYCSATTEFNATLVSWLLHRPDAHSFWHNYIVSLIHLRPLPGVDPAFLHTADATHEVIIIALNPSHEPNPDDVDSIRILTPPNLNQQLRNYTDAGALALVEKMITALVGPLSPDSDHRSCQQRWIEKAARRARETN